MIAFYAQSYYSLLRGVASPAAIPGLARENGYAGALLADRDSLAGAAEFFRAAEAAGIAAYAGVELTDRERRAALAVREFDARIRRDARGLRRAEELRRAGQAVPVGQQRAGVAVLPRETGNGGGTRHAPEKRIIALRVKGDHGSSRGPNERLFAVMITAGRGRGNAPPRLRGARRAAAAPRPALAAPDDYW